MAKSLEEIEASFRAQNPKPKIGKKVKEEPPEKEESKSISRTSLISDIIFYFAMVAMVICAVLFSRGAMGTQSFAGYQFREVLSTSMESVYPRGSLILIKQTSASDLVIGDDITFGRDSANIITHRIVEIEENYEGSGRRAFVTKGTENANIDNGVVLEDNIIGKVEKGIPKLGRWLSWLGGNLWAILAVFVSLIAFSFFLKLFVKYRKSSGDKDNNMKNLI